MDPSKIKKVGKRRVGKPKLYWVQEGRKSAWKIFRSEVDQSGRRNPDRRRKYKAKFSQGIQTMEWALDGRF